MGGAGRYVPSFNTPRNGYGRARPDFYCAAPYNGRGFSYWLVRGSIQKEIESFA